MATEPRELIVDGQSYGDINFHDFTLINDIDYIMAVFTKLVRAVDAIDAPGALDPGNNPVTLFTKYGAYL